MARPELSPTEALRYRRYNHRLPLARWRRQYEDPQCAGSVIGKRGGRHHSVAPDCVGADLTRCHFIEGIVQQGESVPFDLSQDTPELHRAVKRISGATLLVIDAIVSAVAGDMHRENDVRRSLQAVVDFAEAHSCAVIGITHFIKGGAGKAPQGPVVGS